MTDGRLILCTILEAAQSGQSDLSRARKKAASTAMIDVLATQTETFDIIESAALQLAARRGWEIPSPPPRLRTGLSFLRRGRTDSAIAESLIRYHTDRIIRELKIRNGCKICDSPISELFQKLLFCQSSGIRHLQPFL